MNEGKGDEAREGRKGRSEEVSDFNMYSSLTPLRQGEEERGRTKGEGGGGRKGKRREGEKDSEGKEGKFGSLLLI